MPTTQPDSQTNQDPLVRIADALERIADALQAYGDDPITTQLQDIALRLEDKKGTSIATLIGHLG